MKIFNINNKDGTPSKLWIMVREPVNEAAFQTIKDMYSGYNLVEDSNPLDKEIPTGVDVAIVIFNHGKPSIGMVNVNPTVFTFPTKKQSDEYFLKVVETAETNIVTDVNSQSVEALVMIPYENSTDLQNNSLKSDEESDGNPINIQGEFYDRNPLGLKNISTSGKIMGTILTALMISELYQNGREMIKEKGSLLDISAVDDHVTPSYEEDVDVVSEVDINPSSKKKIIKKLKIRW